MKIKNFHRAKEPEQKLKYCGKIFVMQMMGKQVSMQKIRKKFTNQLEKDKHEITHGNKLVKVYSTSLEIKRR